MRKYGFISSEEEGRYKVGSIPINLKEAYNDYGKKFDSAQRHILAEFNQFRLKGGSRRLLLADLEKILDAVKAAIMSGSRELRTENGSFAEDERSFLDWVFSTYSINDPLNERLVTELNKLLYSLLVYTSFASSDRRGVGPLAGKRAYLDTNLLIFSFGVNGLAKQKYAREFFELGQANVTCPR